ncbi:hypothetical protein B0H11DRAFT_1744154, partial [Mycena galericulata]
MGQGQGTDDDSAHDDEDLSSGKRRPLPPFVKNAYDRFTLKAEKHYKDYSTFWVPQQDNFFILHGDAQPTAEAMYTARLYYWDPAYFFNIPCPGCGTHLKNHAFTRPRRVVDMHNCFYMVGRRYICAKCKNATSGKLTVTFNSWDSRIMEALPAHLRDEFPAYLSHRGAMSKPLFEMMRASFQYGLGSKQFSNSLLVLHRLHFDKLHVQYLDGVIAWAKAHPEKFQGSKPLAFTEFSSFDDPNGYSGFVPSSSWLRMMYNVYIEKHGAEMDQQAAMKSLRLGGIDHHYKTTKQIMKINGESVFAATLTLTNEFGEARVLAFVATSSHAEFESALNKVKENLDRYGLSQPEVIFTDNPAADKQFLERVFPSLTKDVVPVEKYPEMEVFEKPENVAFRVCRDAPMIDNEIAKIMDDLNINDSEDKLVVGFDMEWNVAYKNWVIIFQIGHFNGKLPASLISFLSTGQIIKAGRAVKQDLVRLAKETNSGPFHGGVDIARLAKDARVITDARMGLGDLCARILTKKLDKNQDIRVSTNWNNKVLSAEQVTYAALDALASLYIYNRLVKTQLPGRISINDLPGTLVSVQNTDGQLIAQGSISVVTTPIPGAPQVTKTRVRVTVSDVLVPAALVPLHNNKPLESFGPAPFDIVYARNKVFSRIPEPSPATIHNPDP